MNKEEEFRDIKGYEGLYQISDLGRVKRLGFKKERILKVKSYLSHYFKVDLCKNNKRSTKRVHQLVAVAFLGHTPNRTKSLIIDHIDNNPLNNNLNNLQLITYRLNNSKDRKGGTSEYTGVSWDKPSRKWMSCISINKKSVTLGRFHTELEASNAYQTALRCIKAHK